MSNWRAKTYQLKLSRTLRLSLSLRRFRRAKARRAKNSRQLALPISIYGVREVALRIERKGKKRPLAPAAVIQKLHVVAPTTLTVAGALGVAIFGYMLIAAPASTQQPPKSFTISPAVAQAAEAPAAAPASLPASEPTHLSVPDVGIEAGIMSVGLNSNGSMETPPVFGSEVGWYRLGSSPGEVGPAIVVGHLDNLDGPSVFWRLREVQPGSLIHINRADGKVATFRVISLAHYSQDSFPTESVYGGLTYPGLRLITCGGTFNHQTQRYSENTVVYAEFVPENPTPVPSVVTEIVPLDFAASLTEPWTPVINDL